MLIEIVMVILAAIDGEEVPSQVVLEGQELATSFDEELLVLHVMPQETFEELREKTTDQIPVPFAPGMSYGESSSSTSKGTSNTPYTIEDGEQNAAGLAQDVVESTLNDQSGVVCTGRVGDPVTEILNEAERTNARYIVIGGRKRTPIGKVVFGSSTQSILLNADRPVLAVMRAE
jgi:nucleotide-binding universal stress UspA family protein